MVATTDQRVPPKPPITDARKTLIFLFLSRANVPHSTDMRLKISCP